MVFSSLIFLLLFFPVTVVVYYLLPKQLRNLWLTAASIAFYACGEPKLVLLFLAEIVWNWAGALILGRIHPKPWKKLVLILCLIGDLGILILFKYSRFLVQSINNLFGAAFRLPAFVLPIGISFYTFQEISYVIDVYRGETPRKNLIEVALYLAFFPQLIAGPIVLYQDIAPQLRNRSTDWDGVSSGFIRFCAGMCKKVLLANQLAVLADHVFDLSAPGTLCSPMLWMGTIAYALQLFFDFSGYSDMAVGLGAMFGFRLPENFRDPYTAWNMKEFFSRWHITLFAWLRNYIYFPLGGSRKGKWKTIRNLMIVWILTGLWHGANWTFAVWGFLWGILIVLERFCIHPEKRRRAFQVCYRILFLMIHVLFCCLFRSPDVIFAFRMIGRMFSPAAWILSRAQLPVLSIWWHESWIYLLAGILLSFCVPQRLCQALLRDKDSPDWLESAKLACLGLCMALAISFLVNGSYNPFLYFQF